MNASIDESKNKSILGFKFSITVFLNLIPVLYYIDYHKKLFKYAGFPWYGDVSFEDLIHSITYGKFWSGSIVYPVVYIAYAFLIFRHGARLESAINEPFKKFLPIILPILLTVLIFANVGIFRGNANWMIINKLSWCWGIGLSVFFLNFMDFKKIMGETSD